MTNLSELREKAVLPYSLPLTIEQPDIWPFTLYVRDADGYEVLSQGRQCYSSKDRTVADVMEGRSFRADERDQAVFLNEEQVARLNFLVSAANDRKALLDRIEALEKALRLSADRLALLLDVFPEPDGQSDHPTATRYVLDLARSTLTGEKK